MVPNSTTVTMQKFKNKLSGKFFFRAIILVQDAVIDGIGNTPEEAEEDLKMKCGAVLMKNDPAFEAEVQELMEGLPENKKNDAVRIALNMKLSSNNKEK